MNSLNPEKQKQLVVRIASSANAEEKEALCLWIERLLEIKESSLPSVQKAKQAIYITINIKLLRRIVKIIASETKHLFWDKRGSKGKLGIGCAVAGMFFFGGQGRVLPHSARP